MAPESTPATLGPVARIYTASMSTTRLLLLGVVRIFQPAYGYQLRRELITWNVQDWANINPGSIYTGLRTLAKHGYLQELERTARHRPGRTSYKLTADGETEYFTLLREMLWTVDGFHPDRMQAALSFLWSLRRDEVLAALEARIVQLEQREKAEPFSRAPDPGGPGHPEPRGRDVPHHRPPATTASSSGPRSFHHRIPDGAYSFAGEPDDWTPTPGLITHWDEIPTPPTD